MTTTSKPRATLTMPSDTELVITREFKAPRALVFEALSKPEHVKRWYGQGYASRRVIPRSARGATRVL